MNLLKETKAKLGYYGKLVSDVEWVGNTTDLELKFVRSW